MVLAEAKARVRIEAPERDATPMSPRREAQAHLSVGARDRAARQLDQRLERLRMLQATGAPTRGAAVVGRGLGVDVDVRRDHGRLLVAAEGRCGNQEGRDDALHGHDA
jgi:hypothetical protein